MVFKMQGKPMQVISISRENDSSSILQLNEDELNEMLMDEKIKDRVVSVISVAGAFRKGKSFLLDFFLRYMYAKYVYNNLDDNDWLGDDNEPLRGFSWRGGSQRDTIGILIWSEIFLYDSPDGEKVAIILMDTQGTFDCDSTMKDCANIFALSTMISSVQIFNIQSNIQKDDLQHLQLFTEYARIAMDNTGRKPFQKLQFLIRDWTHKSEAPFGALGGKQILQQKLFSKDRRLKENEELCENVKTSFNEIDCYLMPHPGFAIEEPDFCGCLKDLRSEFKDNLRDLIPLILAPENLIIKEINGRKLKVADLSKYISLYFELFNSKEFPEPTTIFMATAEANNQIHARTAEESYEKKMVDITSPENPYMPEEELIKKHEEYVEESISQYTETKSIGKEHVKKKYCINIKKSITSRLPQFIKINKAKLYIAELNYLNDMHRCIQDFENLMDDLFTGNEYTPPNEFNSKMEDVKLNILRQFDSYRSNSTEEIHRQIRDQLEEAVEKLCIKRKQQNDIKWNLIKANMTMECAEAKKLYKELMDNTEESIETLKVTHADAMDRALKRFRGVPHVGAESFFNECENQLIIYIEEKFNSYKERSVNKQQTLQLQLSQLKRNYEDLMKDACENVLTDNTLLSKHKECKMKVLEVFEGLPTKGYSENYMNETRQKLVGEIEELWKYYRSRNEIHMLYFEQKCQSMKIKAKKIILKSLEELGVFNSVYDVRRNFIIALSKAESQYEHLKENPYHQEIYEKYRSELMDEAEGECSWYIKRAKIVQKIKELGIGFLRMIGIDIS
ncbi:atlastin isoform X1 [Bactrocera oleae]|uniref:atlastin isoform X1 n=2 Tax=Bactrocera oleae TaxID=104688 RepID=UPI00387E2891